MMWRGLMVLWDVAKDLGASARLLLRITTVDHIVLASVSLGSAVSLGRAGYTYASVTMSGMAVVFTLMDLWEEFHGRRR